MSTGRRIAIVEGVRTPFVKAGSVARELPAYELGRQAIQGLVAKLDLDLSKLDEVALGCVGNPPEAANVARVAALRAGIPESVPARTLSRNCASGMESITSAAEKILAGQAELSIAGGLESMSQAPLIWPQSFAFWLDDYNRAKTPMKKLGMLAKLKAAFFKPRIGILEGLSDPVCGLNMGQTAEILARDFGITRHEQDVFSCESHRRAEEATKAGFFADEIVPLMIPPKYDPLLEDNGIRKGQSVEALAKLKPFFDRQWGTVTAGNASQLTDGAAAVLVTTEEKAKAEGWKPLGYLTAWAYAGLEPRRMGLGPVYAAAKAMKRRGIALKDLELVEINEAFAAQVLACTKAMESAEFAKRHLGTSEPLGHLPLGKLNVNGGAIALGHPVGVSGTRLVLTLLKEMRRRNLGIGMAALCIGGGQGAALILERS